MSSKSMSNWALLFLVFLVITLCYETFTGNHTVSSWFFIIIATIFNISSAIKKDLETLIKQGKG